jgi:hypothetical protein
MLCVNIFLLDSYGNNGCDGGEDFRAYQWMLKHGGIPTEADYGSYLGQVRSSCVLLSTFLISCCRMVTVMRIKYRKLQKLPDTLM